MHACILTVLLVYREIPFNLVTAQPYIRYIENQGEPVLCICI